MVIVVTKYGMKFYTRDNTKNKIGEQGETEGVLRHLVSQGHTVLYFGVYEGEVPGVIHLRPHLDDLDDLSTAAHQEALWKKDTEMVGDYCPDAAIQINGLAPTFSWIDNPRGARLQAFAVRMCGPWLNILQSLKLKRICINNDPRSYPRDQEMSYGWDYVRPAALLDQCSKVKDTIVGGKSYRRVSHYAKCESYGWLPQRENTRETDIATVAHSHFDDSLGTIAKWELLPALFDRFPDFKVYGLGWPEGDRYPGPVRPMEVLDIVRRAKCSYICDHTEGFKTGKPYVLVSQGCVPCWTMDEIEFALSNYDEAISRAREIYRPDFSVLDEVLDGAYGGGYEPR